VENSKDWVMTQRAVQMVARGMLVALAMVATAGAQQTSVRVRSGARHIEVHADSITVVLDGLDSLLRSLGQSRALEQRIGMALREYGNAAQQANAGRQRQLAEQLQKLAESNVHLMSRIQIACTARVSSEHAPSGYLGVSFGMKGDVRREKNGPEVYRFDEPPEIVSVESGSPADRAGVHRGDRLLAMDGRDVTGHDVIFSTLLVPGRKLPLRVDRDGREQNLVALVQKRPEGFDDQCTDLDLGMAPAIFQVAPSATSRSFTIMRTPMPPRIPRNVAPSAGTPPAPATAPSPPSVWTFDAPPPVAISGYSSIVAGAQLTTLTDDFKELTGAASGVMIQRVLPETPAARAKLRGGDVIVEAGDRQVTSPRVLQRLIGGTDEQMLKLKVVRRGKARTVWLKW